MNNLSTKKLLLLDAFGAALSLVLLLFIKEVGFDHFRINDHVLVVCIGMAAFLLLFDSLAYVWFATLNMLKFIVGMNILYTLFTCVYMYCDWDEIRFFGQLYLGIEVVVLLILIYLEVRHISINSATL